MTLQNDGWLQNARRVVSPNRDCRPSSAAVELLVIHNISLPPACFDGDDVIKLFTNTLRCDSHPFYESLRGQKLSAHFFIRRDGETVQFVSVNERAWHAGDSCWRGRARCNDFSVGVELSGDDKTEFTAVQYDSLITLTARLIEVYPALLVAGHQHISAARKTDPGDFFDWRFYLQKIGRQYDGRS